MDRASDSDTGAFGAVPYATTSVAIADLQSPSNNQARRTSAEAASAGTLPVEPGVLVKHYELIRKLGEGGMGVVFLARDTRLGRLVAIKFLLEHGGPEAQRFLAEARATARCRHENIVVIYDADEFRGYPYMVLEYIEGQTLRAFMTERGGSGAPASAGEAFDGAAAIPPTVVADLMIPVLRAVACAHDMGIVHRDLKPENILLADTGQVKVLDFGIAKHIDLNMASTLAATQERVAQDTELTQAGALVGTLPYMSPEQWAGEGIDAATDVWAIGIILYELLAGKHPLAPLSHARLAQVLDLDTSMPSMSEIRPDMGALGELIDRCLRKRKKERIGSAKDLLKALEPYVQHAPALSEDASPFAGLAAFQETDAGRFFGREREIAAVMGRLRNQQLVALAGPSGAGKSSFVRAGIIPALKRSGERWEALIVRPGRRPLAALADVITRFSETSKGGDSADGGNPEKQALVLRTEPGQLGAQLRARCRRLGSGYRILIFVDQLEELYTLGTDPAEREAFCACLEGVADDASSPLRVVLTIRSDYLDPLANDRRFMREVARSLFFLPPMGRESLREALQKPLESAGFRFEDEKLVTEVLDELDGTRSPLPLLQFTATKLWEARDPDRRCFTRDSYRSLGGVAGALSTHADTVLSGLPVPSQRLARAIFERLVTPERTRAIVSMAELCALSRDNDAAADVVQHLADARLVLVEAGGEREGTTVELIHESLIERWSKLGQWLRESEEDAQFLARLRAVAQQWQKSNEAEGLLWRDRAAFEAERWFERYKAEQRAGAPSGLGKHEERYLVAVVGLVERTRRLRRRFIGGLIAALSVVVVVVSYLAIRAQNETRRAEALAQRADGQAKQVALTAAQAQEEARLARNATRMAAARENQADPTTVLALLREIEPPHTPRGWSRLAYWALYGGVSEGVFTHDDILCAAAFSPDGTHILTAADDRTIRVWNVDGTGTSIVLRGHEDRISSASWSPDGTRILSASSDKTVRVWNADGQGTPLVLRGHEDRLWWAGWSPDGGRILSISLDKTARVWNADGTGTPLVFRGHESEVRAAAWSPEGRRFVTTSRDKTARVWNADGTGTPLVFRGHESEVKTAAWSPEGRRFVTTSSDKTVRVWNADGTGTAVVLTKNGETLDSAQWSPDGHHIVIGSHDHNAYIWNADGTGTPVVLRGHTDAVRAAEWDPQGRRIVTTSEDMTARIWNSNGTGASIILHGHRDLVHVAHFSPKGNRVVTASYDATARVWSLDGKNAPIVLRGHEQMPTSLAFSADGKRILSASENSIRVWNANGIGEPFVLRLDGIGLRYRAAWSPDGGRVAFGSSVDNSAHVWNMDGTGTPVVLRGHEDAVFATVFSPDGTHVATASRDKTARIWNADGTGEPIILRGHEDRVLAIAWSQDGNHILTGSADKTARIWNADGTGEPIILRGHEDMVVWTAWSPDGTQIATASRDKTARIWNADGTGMPTILRGHELDLWSVVYSPDGKRIVTASDDKTVRIWNADGAGEPIILSGPDSSCEFATWSPDGKRIAAGSNDKSIWIWSDLEPLRDADDSRLWTATSYCLPVDVRIRMLGVSEDLARSQEQDCLHRVQKAHQAAAASP